MDLLDGEDWNDSIERAKSVFEGAPILQVSFNEYLGEWLAVYSPPFDHEILARTAPQLTGPWSRASVLYVAPEDHAPYDAVHHPEYEEDGGRVQYLTYSRPTEGSFGAELPLIRVVFD